MGTAMSIMKNSCRYVAAHSREQSAASSLREARGGLQAARHQVRGEGNEQDPLVDLGGCAWPLEVSHDSATCRGETRMTSSYLAGVLACGQVEWRAEICRAAPH
eukprot:832392-Rhodomonas_salina.3